MVWPHTLQHAWSQIIMGDIKPGVWLHVSVGAQEDGYCCMDLCDWEIDVMMVVAEEAAEHECRFRPSILLLPMRM